MTNKLFPTHFRIILDEGERGAMDRLWEHNPTFNEEVDLLHAVLREGIKVMNRAAKNRQPELTRTQLEANKRSMAQSVSEKGILRDPAQTFTEHRHVENYVGFPIGERLRQRLEDFFGDHPDLDDETGFALLLDLGLRKAEEEPELVDPKQVLTDLKSELTRSTTASRKRCHDRLALLRAVCRSSG